MNLTFEIAAGLYLTGSGSQAFNETLTDAVSVLSSLTDNLGMIEVATDLINAGISVGDTRQMVESLLNTVSSTFNVTDSIATNITETLSTAISASTSLIDLQLMVDSITIMSTASATASDVVTFVESLADLATVTSEVKDIFIRAFVGKYVMTNSCTGRSFADTYQMRQTVDTVGARETHSTTRPRTFVTLATPRRFSDQCRTIKLWRLAA